MKKSVAAIATVAVIGGAYWAYSATRAPFWDTDMPLIATTGPLDFLADLDTENVGQGWKERSFFRVTPARYEVVQDDDRRALRCSTNNSASILARDTDIALHDLPILSWSWKLVQPIESDIDESTKAGDDHPMRFYLRFINDAGDSKSAEIIWSNTKYAPGDYKIIGTFHHLVANGLNENAGKWHDQTVDLRTLYADIGGTGTARLDVLGFFCDSDNTGARSDGFFGNITLRAE
ncbi:DUF3047 domain-containing protein [Tateyamaria sp.]|uniref:DUF3047 domain-containing protein n=1 Tax=Tateyamaria sp. TaxID=1929288 RepID=UPI00329E42DD